MRIVSQDGWLDMPYESTALMIEKQGNIYLIVAILNSKSMKIIARYSDESKVQKAMFCCLQSFRKGNEYYYFPEDEEL